MTGFTLYTRQDGPITTEHLKKARERSGLTTRETGDEIGVDGNTISDWEHGRHAPQARHWPNITEFIHKHLYPYELKPDHQLSQTNGHVGPDPSQRKESLLDAISDQLGSNLEIPDDDTVPVEVLTLPAEYRTAYHYAITNKSLQTVADEHDIEMSTLRGYLWKVRSEHPEYAIELDDRWQ